MGIKVEITERNKQRDLAKWRASYTLDLAEWLAQYTGPWPVPAPTVPHTLTCPYCCPTLRRLDKGVAIEGGRLVRMNRQHPLRRGLHFWERRQHPGLTPADLVPSGMIGRIYYPGDHEVCPYDNHFRLQTAETMGGYRQSGPLDGNGVRARLMNGPTDDSFELRWSEFYGPDGFVDEWHPGSYVTDPAPDVGCEWVDEYIFRTSRATRIVPHPGSRPESVVLDFADDRGRDDHFWHPDKKFINWGMRWYPRRTAFQFSREPLQTFQHHPTAAVAQYAPRVVPAPNFDVFSFWSPRPWRLQPRVKLAGDWPPQHMEFLACLMCLKHWATDQEIRMWKRKYWENRREKWVNLSEEQRRELPVGRNRRKLWKANWRTDRKMRDLTASLKLENDGWDKHDAGLRVNPPRYNVPRMLEVCRRKLRHAVLEEEWAKGISAPREVVPYKTKRREVNSVPPVSPAPVYEPRQTYLLRKPVTFPRLPFQLTFNFWQESTAQPTTQTVPNYPEIPRFRDFSVHLNH